jgi:hypothetical protein
LLASFRHALQFAAQQMSETRVYILFVILGPKEPKKQINIFLHLLIEELKELWQEQTHMTVI